MEHRTRNDQVPAPGQPNDRPRDPGYEDGLDELPPNVPPGLLGERGLNLYKEETGEPRGLNAGLLQESSAEVVWLAIFLAYVLFFPLAYVIVWRTKSIPRTRKWVVTGVLTVGVVTVAVLFATGVLYL